jgi:sugar-specific transcriptional regulator TrmB
MSDQTDKLKNLLKPFGLNDEESSIYLILIEKGANSALEISRLLHMGRTKVYRILDKLIKKSLVNEKMDDSGKRFEASSIDKLEMMIEEKENELEKLKESKKRIFKELSFFKAKDDKKSKALYYSGKEGLKQITWNSLKAKDTLYIFEMGQSMTPFTGIKFSEKVREELIVRKIFTKQLTNYKKIEAYTKLKQYPKDWWEVRYIDPKELSLDFELLIYNDTVAIYTYKNEEYFGVEIYNEDLAKMQKQMFNFIWSKGKKMKIGKGGEAKVTN